MEVWQWAISAFIAGCGVLTPLVLALMARDRSLLKMIEGAKNDARVEAKAGIDQVHDRIGRVRDEYVRRDDLDGHLRRIEKTFDDIKEEQRRAYDRFGGEFRELKQLLNSMLAVERDRD